jgi:hypothetical protein
MFTDNEKAKLFTEPPFLPAQEKFTKDHCGNLEAVLTSIEGLSAILIGWSIDRAERPVSQEETWGLHIVTNMIHDLSIVGQRIMEA